MPKVVVMGFIGCGNLGDEAILAGTLQALRSNGILSPTVFSWTPGATAKNHNVQALPVLPGLSGLIDFAGHLRAGDLFLLGGGSLLQDGQRRIVPFWLARALIAKMRGCTVVYHAQGVGPLRTSFARRLVKYLVPPTADLFTVRDQVSVQLLPSSVKCEVVADPALLLAPIVAQPERSLVVVALRHTKHDALLQPLAESLRLFAQQTGAELLFLPMHYPDDVSLSETVAAAVGGRVYNGPPSVDAVRTVLGSAELVIAMRLHAAILAVGENTPTVGLAYDPKVEAFLNEVNLPKCMIKWGENFTSQDFSRLLLQSYNSRHTLRVALSENIENLRARAERSIPLALARWRCEPLGIDQS